MLGSLAIAAGAVAMLAGPMTSPDIRPVAKHHGSKRWFKQPRRKIQRLADPEFAAVVNQFTNWERNRWAGAGYPGLKGKDVQKVSEFLAAIRRRNEQARAA